MRIRFPIVIGAGLVVAALAWSQRAESSRVFAVQAGNDHRSHAQAGQNVRAGGKAAAVPLAVAVDGSKTPEDIPDDIAYKHFVLALAITSNPPPTVIRRRDLILAQVGLSVDDRSAIINALGNVKAELGKVAAERALVKPEMLNDVSGLATAAALKAREDAVLEGARQRVELALSFDGFTRMQTYVHDQVKRRIVIYGDSAR